MSSNSSFSRRWYVTSAICNTTARKLLTTQPLPLFLCVAQFTIAYLSLLAYFRYWRRAELPRISPTNAEASESLRRVAFVYTAGFVFVNAGYVAVNVSLAETLRSAEPLFSVIFAKLWLADERVSRLTLATLFPIVLGGALSSGGDTSFNFFGFLFVCASNTCFALRSVFTKHLKKTFPAGDAMQVFYLISEMGLTWLTIVFLGWEIIALVFSNQSGEGEEVGTLDSKYGLFASIIASRKTKDHHHHHRQNIDAESISSSTTFPLADLAALVVVNGLTYFIYNQMSFLVLSKVTVVTHAVGNSLRRVVTILFSIWYFRNQVVPQNALGIVLAIFGVLAYSFSKSRDEKMLLLIGGNSNNLVVSSSAGAGVGAANSGSTSGAASEKVPLSRDDV